MKSLSVLGLLLCGALWLGIGASPAHAAATRSPSHTYVATVASFPATATNASTVAQGATLARQSASTCSYVVKRGDYLSRIAPANWRAVAAFNHIANPSRIFPGERINVCVSSSQQQPQEKQFTTMIPANVGGTAAAHASSTQSAVTPQAVSYSSGVYGPCHGGSPWVANPGSWITPNGCYAGIFQGVSYGGSSDCFALVQAITGGRVHSLARHSTPIVGAVMFFPSGNQGASSVGHWAYVTSIGNGMLVILEQNDSFRGGGYGRLDYRFVYSTGIYYY